MSKKLLLLVFILLAILAYLDYRTIHGEEKSRNSFVMPEKYNIPKNMFAGNTSADSDYQKRILFMEFVILNRGRAHE
ncbi:MAG: hypothetical protein WC716_16495 [Chitinophagaceae bacterium]|jgi:hypothetical protein